MVHSFTVPLTRDALQTTTSKQQGDLLASRVIHSSLQNSNSQENIRKALAFQ